VTIYFGEPVFTPVPNAILIFALLQE